METNKKYDPEVGDTYRAIGGTQEFRVESLDKEHGLVYVSGNDGKVTEAIAYHRFREYFERGAEPSAAP